MRWYAILSTTHIIERFHKASDKEAMNYMLETHGKDCCYILFKVVKFN
jgi:hypothetical protein